MSEENNEQQSPPPTGTTYVQEYQTVPFVRNLLCSLCDAVMVREGIMSLTDPPQFKYKCPTCDNTYVSTVGYPEVDLRKVVLEPGDTPADFKSDMRSVTLPMYDLDAEQFIQLTDLGCKIQKYLDEGVVEIFGTVDEWKSFINQQTDQELIKTLADKLIL